MEGNWPVYADETLDDLIIGGYKLLQGARGYRFSIDSVLLAHFVRVAGIQTVVDLGSGNAVIPIILAARNRELQIAGLELQPGMVDRARRSIDLNQLQERIAIYQGDIRRIRELLPGGYAELVVSNPPFWRAKEGKISSNPEQAIARHELELTVQELIEAAAYLLQQKGRFALIHRADRLLEIAACCQEMHLYPRRIRMIHPFKHRPANLLLLEASKNLPGQLEIMPPLILYEKPGLYCQEIREIYRS